MDNMTIREARICDAREIAGLSGELGYPSPTERTVERLRSLIARKENGVLVALSREGSVLGWIHVYITHLLETDPFAELGGFVVTAERRGQGIGKHLMAEVERWVAQRGISKIRIRSRSTRVDAHAFYEKCDYRIDKTQHVFEKTLREKL
jgi:GNAT superfamily N-acetyltransferase